MELALYQPDIPQNLGAVFRLCACFGIHLHVIEPCGFPLDEKRIRRAGMDYMDAVSWQRHGSWDQFAKESVSQNKRLILATTRGAVPYYKVSYGKGDIVLFGQESAGAPEHIHEAADERILIPMQQGMRSLNLAMSAAIIAAEGIRR